MVMHARKLPRISDGFNEKHQTHGYENSKYGSKYRYSNHEKSRDSPSTNSLRSSSPDSRSQSPRYHHKAPSYYKIREKERERDRETRERDRDRERERERDRERERERERERDRDRDYHYRDRDDSRSPKERRREVRDRDRDRERERDGRGNHDRINSVHKKEDKERLGRVGDWSEHVSSSGKKYYYNCRTEVSQWEKPPEWLEWERARAKDPSNRSHEKSSARQDKHSSLGESYREVRDIRDNVREERSERDRREIYRSDDYERRDNRKVNKSGGADDMEISSGDSTPTSEHHHNRGIGENSHEVSGANVSLASSLVSTSGTTLTSTHSTTAPPTLMQAGLRPNMGMLPTSLPTSLPPLGSSSTSCAGTNTITTSSLVTSIPALVGSTPMAVPQLLPHHPRLSTLSNSMNSKSGLSLNDDNVNHSSIDEGHVGKLEPLSISANSNNIGGGGPPTPTHSENQDGIDIRKVGSPTSSINSLQSLTQTAGGSLAGLRPVGPTLTPSLANYYKESLISHVQNWPAEALEKPAQRLSEEAHSIGSLVMTRVSAELKMARSLVRLAEIQATLHEQRILFLRAQKRELEDMKSQNCFMSDT
ncbi:hypothetical protein SK128_019268 [Halocaridina rubra]|uniref:WW domain-containing protein n=1 Tax=Halocaridina rubra TaxID=373956 RepID=A0AAN8XLG0_HALRR